MDTAQVVEKFRQQLMIWFEQLTTFIRNLPISTNCAYLESTRILGQGGYGKVILAYRDTDPAFFAIKHFTNPLNPNDESTIKEICFLNQLTHENVAKMVEVCISGGKFFKLSLLI